MRLIDADALIEKRFKMHSEFLGTVSVVATKDIDDAPTIDPESLRKKGEWRDNHCSACGMMPMGEELWEHCDVIPPKMEWFMDFCPCCGADMRGE